MSNSLLRYGAFAVVTSPLWVPAAFVGYVGYKVARSAFKHPWVATGTIAAAIIYYTHGFSMPFDLKREFAERSAKHSIEEKVEEPLEQGVDDQYTYHYLQPGETISGLAHRIGTDDYERILDENRIDDPRRIPAGFLVRIPRELQTRKQSDVYAQVPKLHSSVVPRGKNLESIFGRETDEVLEFNKKLGLDYSRFRGERIVYEP